MTDAGTLTIDELAARTGMTVRNLRAHQSRGLLAPPQLRGRTGYYGAEHVARVELVRELQADGFNLELIRRLLDASAGSASEVLRFAHALHAPFGDERPEVVELTYLVRTYGSDDPEIFERCHALGLLRPLPDGRVELVSPRLARAAAELLRLGIPLQRAIDVCAQLRRQADEIARTYVELFLEAVWQPFVEAGQPEGSWPGVLEAAERLRPLAAESVLAVFQIAMGEAVEQGIDGELHPRDTDAVA